MKRTIRPSYSILYAAIFNRIIQGYYRPTHRIGIAQLADQLGVSTTPVREALRQLAGRDIIVERHREGFYVAPLNARAISALYRAHGRWFDMVLEMPPMRPPTGRASRNLWRLFDNSAARSGDLALVAVRRYLDDRLAILRRHEPHVVLDMNEQGAALSHALAHDDIAAARLVTARFHEQCAINGDQLATLLDPGS